ncbi:hypothetical protein N7453_011554 [Penicillium expansum]|nr:hypothetical protein N7453_011554 [Penicillium expansum]
MIICLKQMFWTSPKMSTEGGEDIETGIITMSIPGTVIGPDTTKIRTGDGPVVIVPYMGDGLTTNGPGMEEGPNTADGRDTEMTMNTDDKTTWELIKENEYTSRLAELLAEDKNLIEILNSTTANHTFFALTNYALEGLPRRNGPSPKFMSSLLRYHILPGRFTIQHIAGHGTLPTKLTEPALESDLPQRIVVREHHDGVILNERSRVVGADMKTKNGIIHIITSPLHPPPETRTMLHQAPADFGIFTLALKRTKLASNLDPAQRQGGTTFAPTNAAFRRLGERANRYLFSRQGRVMGRSIGCFLGMEVEMGMGGKGGGEGGLEEESANVRLGTLLKDRDLRVDVKKEFGEVDLRVNGFGRVGRLDLLARDGVMHVLDRVLVPSRDIQDKDEGEHGEELMIEELVERLHDCVYGGDSQSTVRDVYRLTVKDNNLKFFIPMFVFQSR